jgi:hypothetical protein
VALEVKADQLEVKDLEEDTDKMVMVILWEKKQ